MEQGISKIQEWSMVFGMKVLAAVLILVIGRFIAIALRKLIRRLLHKGHMEETLISFISNASYILIMTFVIIAALGQLGVQTASLIAVLGAAGLAVGFALQGSLANFAAGVLMAIFKPFKTGDFIEGAGVMGTVQEIGFFTTELQSPDNKKIIIPNAKLSSDNITNYSSKDQRRVDIITGVSYKDNIDKVRKVLEEVIAADSRILKEPAPTIAVMELANSSVKFAVRPWVKTSDYWDVYFSLQEQIKKRFDAEGITIPFPQQDIHLHQKT
jgi:small conductance mechanosensitive channel